MLCDGRVVCGCADPYGKRVLGDARTTTVGAIWTGETASKLRRDLNAGGSTFCGDCPLKLPLAPDEAAAAARSLGRGVRRFPAGCTSSARPPATSRASRRAARPRPASPGRGRPACSTSTLFTARHRRSRPDARPHRLLQLRRGVPAQARRRDVRDTSSRSYPHIYLYTSTNGLAPSPRNGAGGWCGRASTR